MYGGVQLTYPCPGQGVDVLMRRVERHVTDDVPLSS